MMAMKMLCDRVREISYDIHIYHGHGHLEKVYGTGSQSRVRRHSREGGNPVRSKVPYSRILDSHLRGNDGGHRAVNRYPNSSPEMPSQIRSGET